MTWLRWLVVALVVFEAGFMVFDGSRALFKGDYLTPSSGPYAGRLGPWAEIVRIVGIEPRSTLMKSAFVLYGLAWLGVAVAFAVRAPWAWAAMLIAAIGSLWYLVAGTVTSAVIIVLLLLPAVREQFSGTPGLVDG